jgi:hypothetical protein
MNNAIMPKYEQRFNMLILAYMAAGLSLAPGCAPIDARNARPLSSNGRGQGWASRSRQLIHLTVESIVERIEVDIGFLESPKRAVILSTIFAPRFATLVRNTHRTRKKTVHNPVSSYNRDGLKSWKGPEKGGKSLIAA